MIRHLDEYPTMKKMFQAILFEGNEFAYNPYTKEMNLACMFGYAVDRDGKIQIVNRIFEMCLYNYFLSEGRAAHRHHRGLPWRAVYYRTQNLARK